MISVAQEQKISLAERAVLSLAAGLVAAGITGYYLLGDLPQVVRVLAVLAGLVAGAGVASRTATGRRTIAYAGEARAEVRRVIWPTRAEALRITGVVAIAVVVGALVLWMFDWVVAQAVGLLIGIGG